VPADLDDSFTAIRIVRVAGEKQDLDALYDYTAYVGCSVGLFKVPVEMDQKPMAPRCSDLTAIETGNRLDFVTLRAEIIVVRVRRCVT
jgi:hypothetical protein